MLWLNAEQNQGLKRVDDKHKMYWVEEKKLCKKIRTNTYTTTLHSGGLL